MWPNQERLDYDTKKTITEKEYDSINGRSGFSYKQATRELICLGEGLPRQLAGYTGTT